MDFVVYNEVDFVAIEVKNKEKLDNKDFSGLKSFKQDYPEARAILLYRGERQYLEGDVLVIPAEKYLLNLAPDKPSPDILWRR